MARTGKQKGGDALWRLLFLIYCGVMIWLLFGQRIGDRLPVGRLNLVPLQTLKLYRDLLADDSASLVRHAFINLAGNVILFIPLGWFLPKIWEKTRKFFVVLLIVSILVFGVETLQYFTGLGSCDIDDLILNIPGAMLGYLIWAAGNRRTKK